MEDNNLNNRKMEDFKICNTLERIIGALQKVENTQDGRVRVLQYLFGVAKHTVVLKCKKMTKKEAAEFGKTKQGWYIDEVLLSR